MNPRYRRRPRAAGFSVVEVLVALVVFGLGALTLVTVASLGVRKNVNAGQQSRASELAARCAERLLTVPYNHADLDQGNHEDAANPHDRHDYLRWTVEEDQPADGCKRVTITVHRPTTDAPAEARLVVVSAAAG